MSEADWPEAASGELAIDEDWLTWESVKLRINPELGAEARAALKMDYGMEGEIMELRVRRALLAYLQAELFIDGRGHGVLPHHFVMDD